MTSRVFLAACSAAITALSAVGCAPLERVPAHAAPPASLLGTRVLARTVSLRDPVSVAVSGDDVVVRYGVRARIGSELRIDPRTLEPRAEKPVAFAQEPCRPMPPHLRLAQASVGLADGTRLVFTTDDASGSVLAHAVSRGGEIRGEPVVVSTGLEVTGAPRAATADGRTVVVVFFVGTDVGFDLVAASLDGGPKSARDAS